MNNVQRQRELAERIADDERHAAAVRKAAEYDALAARLEVLEAAFDNSHKLNEQLGDENRALLARAEAAEAERDDANIEAALEQGNAAAAWQRVADLEAELAAVKAAGEWRTTDPPRNGVFLAEITAVASDDVIRQWGPGGNILRVSRWRPLPQPDAPQEPTS